MIRTGLMVLHDLLTLYHVLLPCARFPTNSMTTTLRAGCRLPLANGAMIVDPVAAANVSVVKGGPEVLGLQGNLSSSTVRVLLPCMPAI